MSEDVPVEHLHRYAFAKEFAQAKDVLEIACGEGFGTHFLRDAARSVLGVDVSPDLVLAARQRYVRDGLRFEVGSRTKLPLEDGSVDVVVSFEVIERHETYTEMLSEIRRVLRPDGALIISSPIRHESLNVPAGINSSQAKGLDLNEFRAILCGQFRQVEVYGQRVCLGSTIARMEPGNAEVPYVFSGGAENIESVRGIDWPEYLIAVASDTPMGLERAVSSLQEMAGHDRQAAPSRDRHPAPLERQAAQFELNASSLQIAALNQIVYDRDGQVASLNEALRIANLTIAQMASSRSWRITRPLRQMRLLLSRPRLPPVRPPDGTLTAGAQSVPAEAQTKSVDPDGHTNSFDAALYLKLYPDVRDHPYEHFVAHGRSEGRLGFLPPLEHSGNFAGLNSRRETVLVVSHEASTTGAPVLSLNIAQELMKKYNVVVLLLNGGSIVDAFKASVDIVAGPIGRHPELATSIQVSRLLAKCKIKFAIVNSVESRAVLPELARQGVPSVALIHEFASNTRPRDGIQEAVFWASETIFSADVVRDNAVSAFPGLAERLPRVIPQGKCSLETSENEASAGWEAARIRETFRPAGWPQDTVVVLGVGMVHIRKGVDLFVACAARVLRSLGHRPCRFIWIGGGYDPERDTNYSLYLEDQVRRAGLRDCFVFMNETSRIDLAYEHADVLVLSSRLDPLPNVTVDAMFHGLPFACFDKATGVADILKTNGLAKECVAPYLDIEELALCVLRFIVNPDLRLSVGNRLKEIAGRVFDMPTYVKRLEDIALQCVPRTAQESEDCSIIAGSDLLDLDYVAGLNAASTTRGDAIRRFVRSWSNGFVKRKPYAGLHPGIYLERRYGNRLASNPFADYLRAGSPPGPWLTDVIRPVETGGTTARTSAIALHLHIFYSELASVIIDRLSANRMRPDLFISVPSQKVKDEIKRIVDAYEGKVIEVEVVPNRGRDIGAFLTAFGRVSAQYEFVGHFHTKKTADLSDSVGKNWFAFLLENLLGGRHRMADIILERMAADPSIGIVFPDDPYIVGWSVNRRYAIPLATKMGLGELPVTHFNFPVGSMFWARSSAVQPLIELHLNWSDYPEEPLPYDGTLLHAIERLFPFVVEKAGFRAVVTNVPGVTR